MFASLFRYVSTTIFLCFAASYAVADSFTFAVSGADSDLSDNTNASLFSSVGISGTLVFGADYFQNDGSAYAEGLSWESADLDVTIDGQTTSITPASLIAYGGNPSFWQFTNAVAANETFVLIDQSLFNDVNPSVLIGSCDPELTQCAIADYVLIDLSVTWLTSPASQSRRFRPDAYTAAPDVRPGNFATCDGRTWVPGFKVAGQLFIQHKYSDKCFDEEVTFLPDGLRVYDRAAVTRFIGQPIDFYYWQ